MVCVPHDACARSNPPPARPCESVSFGASHPISKYFNNNSRISSKADQLVAESDAQVVIRSTECLSSVEIALHKAAEKNGIFEAV